MAGRSRVAWSLCLVMGCAPSPAARQVTTNEPPAPASSAAPAWMAPAASSGRAIRCSDTLMRLPFGHTIHDTNSFLIAEGAERVPFADVMPSLDARGLQLVSATGIELQGDPTARWIIVAPKDVQQARSLDERGVFPSVERAVATCSSDGGYMLLGAPHDKATDVRIDVTGAERVTWPDGSVASSVTFESTRRDGTYDARVVVLGRATTAWPLRAPNDRGIGELADIGIVSQWVNHGGERYVHTRHLPPSGWYPLGAKAAYLQVRRDNSEAGWQENADVVLELRAVMGPDGIAIHPMPNHAPTTTWALVGPGPMPAWCAQRDARVRCGELQVPGSFVTPDTSWIAGVWATPSEAMNAARALGVDPKTARWMAIDPPQRARAVTGPDGRSALGLLQLTRKPLPPPPPHH